MFTRAELYEKSPKRTFTNEAKEAAFLLGGIGTGNVSLGSRGEFRDWEIFNRPGKRNRVPNTHFAIWAQEKGKEPVAKVLEAALTPPYSSDSGFQPDTAAGLPRLARSTFTGEYPIARIDFEDLDLPVQVSLEAFTPFIPLNEDESGIPGAYITYRIKNITNRMVDVTIAGSICNPIGMQYDGYGSLNLSQVGQNVNEFREQDGFSGLYLHSLKYNPSELPFGNLSLVTTNPSVTVKRVWLRGTWFDYLQEFWDDFSADGVLEDLGDDGPSDNERTDSGTLGVLERLQPGETKEFCFILTWYMPNRINGWNDTVRVRQEGFEITQNYYASMFDSSWSVASFMVKHADRLRNGTFAFHDALFNSSLPHYVIDCLANNLTVLRSTTCFRLKDGRLLGYEGSFDTVGSCEGNCTHVWNYAQSVAFLFPKLEQSMRTMEFLDEVMDDGKMNFRAYRLFDIEWLWWGDPNTPAAADGQLGAIMRVYREWKMTGDDAFLIELWSPVQKVLEFALSHWDTNGDLILDGKQHNTYDIEFYGPNPLSGVMLLGALKAASEMARYLGEVDLSQQYLDKFELSSRRLDEWLWNGEYYVQKVEDVDQCKYQFGQGCLSDQVLGQELAHLYGLGYLLPRDRMKKTVQSIYRNNFKCNFSNHVNCQRTYVFNDEKGLVLCSWPQGGRPRFPFVYSDEVWTGVEYQVATHLIYEQCIDEGLTLVRAIWERQDGVRRNPWNEVECGNHYVRAMASWGLLIALSGFEFDMSCDEIRFAPVINQEDFTTFWSTGKAWGTFSQRLNHGTGEWTYDVQVLYGNAKGTKVSVADHSWIL